MAVVVLLCACTISGESDNATLVRPGGAGTPTGTSSSNTTAADGAAVTPGGDSAAGETSGGAASDTGSGKGSVSAGDTADTGSSGSNETGAPGDTAADDTAPGDTAPGEGRDSDGDGGDDGGAPPEETGGDASTDGDASTGGDSGSGTGADTPPQTTTTTGPFTIAETAFDERSKVSTVGIGSVYFGMSPEEAANRARTAWDGIPAGGADCYVVTPTNGPPGVALWVYHGAIERVEIDTPLLRTQSGLGVGTTLSKLQDLLGEKLVVENHPSLRGWILAMFVPTAPNDAAFRIAFDISDGKVARFRAGRTEIVVLESCA